MKAMVYGGPGSMSWTDVPDPAIIHPGDAVIQVDAVTICGTDLHILGGDVPAVTPGRVLGHEAVGTVVDVGSGVNTLAPGDRVLASCITACGTCRYCRVGSYGQCLGGGGWILGHKIDGVQAEFARLPFADLSTYKLGPRRFGTRMPYSSPTSCPRPTKWASATVACSPATPSSSLVPGRSVSPRSSPLASTHHHGSS